MKYYYPLPNIFSTFVKPFDYQARIEQHNCSVVFFDTQEVLTDYAQCWFADHGFVLCDQHVFFEKPPNVIGPIHSDGIEHDYDGYGNNYAFNWVVQGHGTMEWIDIASYRNRNLTKVSVPVEVYFHTYQDIQNYEVIDSWSGNMALVNVKQPHRVNTTTEFRYCLSLRTKANCGPVNFEDALASIL